VKTVQGGGNPLFSSKNIQGGNGSFSNLFKDGNHSRRKPFILENRSCNRYVQGGNPFIFF
jgi:hypothetical protein